MSLQSNARFSRAPSVKLPRTAFKRPHSYKSTWNLGDLIPFYWDMIYPGDTVSMDVSSVVRMSTPVKPIMDNVVLDKFFFFVPLRLIDKNFEKVMGGLDTTDVWKPAVEFTVPQLIFPGNVSLPNSDCEIWYKVVNLTQREFNDYMQHQFIDKDYLGRRLYVRTGSGPYTYTLVGATDTYSASNVYCHRYAGWGPSSLAAYMGLPIGCSPMIGLNSKLEIMQYPFRAYIRVWNDFFRDQNYMLPADDHYDQSYTVAGKNWRGGDYTSQSNNGGEAPGGLTYNYITDTIKGAKPLRVSRFHDLFSSGFPQPQRSDAISIPIGGVAPIIDMGGSSAYLNPFKLYNDEGYLSSSRRPLDTGTGTGVKYDANAVGTGNVVAYVSQAADLSNLVGQSTINDLRVAFQLQRFSETYALSGTRYIEIIRGFFGVINPDYRLQRPEYLGGDRKYLNVSQVLQTSSTDSITPQGNTAAYSLTTSKDSVFTKSFTEHGILLGLVCTRVTHSYQMGYNKQWKIKRKYDFMWPQFAHLGYVPTYNYELYCYAESSGQNVGVATPSEDVYAWTNGVFNYNEMYSELRYYPDLVTGSFISQGPTPLDFWHFADYYDKAPFASMDWLLESPASLDRCLAVTSDLADQFIGDFYFDAKYVRALPMYSIPGLADHF